jgi:SAM-dependent methyltransferase
LQLKPDPLGGRLEADSDRVPPSQFYSGLVAELYDPLAGEVPQVDQYALFLDVCGTPALELACGSGAPMLDLLERGYDVAGLDSSRDMLELCLRRGEERRLVPSVHLGLMQSFRLPQQFRSIFLAGASFTLLTSDADASASLVNIYAHLEAGGHTLIPIEQLEVASVRKALHQYREITDPTGTRMRVAVISCDPGADAQSASLLLRYERIPEGGDPVILDRTWERRWWSQAQFREMLLAAAFSDPTFLDPKGDPADADANGYVALARKP